MCVGLPSFIINDRYIIKSDAWTADAAAIQGRIYIHRRVGFSFANLRSV